jgi:hypothetical protein
MAFVAPFALGGIWFAYFLWRLSAFPILPEYDFNETQALVLHHSDEQEAAWEELFSNAR